MPTAVHTTARTGVPVAAPRNSAIAAGVLFLLTHLTGVGALILYGPVLNTARYIVGAGPDTRVLVGACPRSSVPSPSSAPRPRCSPSPGGTTRAAALGYVGLRTLDASIVAAGVVPLLAVVTLRQQLAGTAGADTATLVALGHALVAAHTWTFPLGPGLVCGANTVLLASLLYRSGLVPRFIPVLGLIGGPLLVASSTAVLFGISEQLSGWAAITAVLVFVWELTLAIRLIATGFTAAAIAAGPASTEPRIQLATRPA